MAQDFMNWNAQPTSGKDITNDIQNERQRAVPRIPYTPGERQASPFPPDMVAQTEVWKAQQPLIERNKILVQRESEYGNFSEAAAQAVYLKQVMHGGKAYLHDRLSSVQKEALDLICTKLARICNNPNHYDSWLDIKGYVDLVLETLPNTQKGTSNENI